MKRALPLLILFSVLCLAPGLRAIIISPLSVEELTDQAEWIVQGMVRAKTCQADASGRIYTRVELELTEVWKGKLSAKTLEIVQGGGTLGERRSVVPFQAEYAVGEEVVAFLVRNTRGEAVTLGLAQGKFGVWTERGEKMAANALNGRPMPSGASLTAGATNAAKKWTVTELKRRVQVRAK
ncbi:MAG: hypothetical protein AB1813_14550 [Verrucomicrobiota bacterium]